MWLNKDAALSLHSPNKREKMKEKLGKRRSKTEMVHSNRGHVKTVGSIRETVKRPRLNQENSENKTTKKERN